MDLKDYNFKNKTSMRPVFKAVLDPEEYKRYTQFAYIKQLKAQMPGSQVLYLWHKNGIACATNALCINDWLVLHDLEPREQITDYIANIKININGSNKIDNRSAKWADYKTKVWEKTENYQVGPGRGEVSKTKDPTLIWNMYTVRGMSVDQIAQALEVTPPAIYYHLKKFKKTLTDQQK